jgi:hypothetical protein
MSIALHFHHAILDRYVLLLVHWLSLKGSSLILGNIVNTPFAKAGASGQKFLMSKTFTG